MFIKKSEYNFLKSTRNSYEQSYYSSRSEIQRLHSVIKRQEDKIEDLIRSNAMKDSMLEARNNIIFKQNEERAEELFGEIFNPPCQPEPTPDDYRILEEEHQQLKANHVYKIEELKGQIDNLSRIKENHQRRIKEKNIRINELESQNKTLRNQIKRYQSLDSYSLRRDF